MPSAILDPAYIRKNIHGKEGHSASRDNFGEHQHEPKKLTPLLELRADKSGGACLDCLILTDLTRFNMVICRNVGPTRRVTAGQATPLGKPTVCLSCKQFATHIHHFESFTPSVTLREKATRNNVGNSG